MSTKCLFSGQKGSSVLQVNVFVPVKPEVNTTDLKESWIGKYKFRDRGILFSLFAAFYKWMQIT